jgi:uncharacterized protein (TIGR04255 family)
MDWEPAHADHSIDSVNVSFTFAEPIDTDAFDEVVIAVRRAATVHNFSKRIESQEPADQPSLPTVPGQPINLSINLGTMMRRVAFQRPAEDVVASEFSIGSKSLTMWTVRYRRWVNFFAELADLFSAVDSVWPLSARVKTIRLQYVDRFVSIPGGASHFEVIAREMPNFLVIPQRDPTAAFHVHNGWFDYDTLPGVRILTNINIDSGDVRNQPNGQRFVTFLTLMQYESLYSFLQDPLDQTAALHRGLKNLFRQLISPEAAARVGLPE